MGARKTPQRAWEQREVRAAKLVKRLETFAHCDASDPENGPKLMTKGQVTAAVALLKKMLPDLKTVELVGDPTQPVVTKIVREIVDATGSADRESVQAPTGAEPV